MDIHEEFGIGRVPPQPFVRQARTTDMEAIFHLLQPEFFWRQPVSPPLKELEGIAKTKEGAARIKEAFQSRPFDQEEIDPLKRNAFPWEYLMPTLIEEGGHKAYTLRAKYHDIAHGSIAPFQMEDLIDSIDQKLVYVVQKMGLIIATGSVLPRPGEGGIEYEVARVITAPTFRGNGYMRDIVSNLEARAKSLGADHVRTVSKGDALQGFLDMGYVPAHMPQSRADQICEGCQLKDICPETPLIKSLYGSPA